MLEAYQRITNNLVRRVNEQRGIRGSVREAMAPRKLRQQFVADCRAAAQQEVVTGMLAEASVRLIADKFLITERHCWWPQLEEENLVIAAQNREWFVGKQALPERVDWHRLVYAATEARAVLLCQPVAVLRLAALGWLPDGKVWLDVETAVSAPILTTPDNVTVALVDHDVVLVAGVGLLTTAASLNQAIARAETVAHWCQTTLAMNE